MSIKRKDYILLTALLIISFISVYFTPMMVNRIVFLLLLIAAYRSKLDYVYLVWFFIINDAPGRLFSATEFGALRIPLYPVTAGESISFQELFLILYILKCLQMTKPLQFIFKKEFAWFLLFGCWVAGYSLLFGMNFDNMVRTFRALLPWSLIFIVPSYIYNRQILVRASLLLFPVVFLAFASQLFTYFTDKYPDDYLRGTKFILLGIDQGKVSRSYSAVYITLLCIIQALYFYFNRKSEINQNYLGTVMFVGFFSTLLTATRGWIVALSLLLLGVLFLSLYSMKIIAVARLAIVSAVVFWIAVFQFPVIERQLDASYQRVKTLEAIAAGDITAGGTSKRLAVRAPRVMRKFWESPLVGWGFSNDYYKYQDGHVGHHNILLNIGILGYIFVNGLFIFLCLKIYRLEKNNEIRLHEGKAPLIYLLGLMAVFVIHSSSTQFWGYHLDMVKNLFFGFFFAAVNAALIHRMQMPR